MVVKKLIVTIKVWKVEWKEQCSLSQKRLVLLPSRVQEMKRQRGENSSIKNQRS